MCFNTRHSCHHDRCLTQTELIALMLYVEMYEVPVCLTTQSNHQFRFAGMTRPSVAMVTGSAAWVSENEWACYPFPVVFFFLLI